MKKIIDILNNYRRKKAIHQLVKELIYLIFISSLLLMIIVSSEYIFYIEVYLRSRIILFFISLFGISISYITANWSIKKIQCLKSKTSFWDVKHENCAR